MKGLQQTRNNSPSHLHPHTTDILLRYISVSLEL